MSPVRRLTCAETPACRTYSAVSGTTSETSRISHFTLGLACGKAMEYAPEPPPRSRMRRTLELELELELDVDVPRAFTSSGARSLALRCMPAMKSRVHSGGSSRSSLRGTRVPLRTAPVSVLQRCQMLARCSRPLRWLSLEPWTKNRADSVVFL